MAYWVIQAIIAVIMLLGGLSDIDTDRELHGLANTFAYAGTRVALVFLITHFLIRTPINFLRNKESGFFKIFVFGIIFVVIGAYLGASLRELGRDVFKPID